MKQKGCFNSVGRITDTYFHIRPSGVDTAVHDKSKIIKRLRNIVSKKHHSLSVILGKTFYTLRTSVFSSFDLLYLPTFGE